MKALAVTGAMTPLDALPPCAATLVALAEWQAGAAQSPDFRTLLCADPGMTLAWLTLEDNSGAWPMDEAASAEHAQRLLAYFRRHEPPVLAEWQAAPARDAYRSSQVVARLARTLASRCDVDPDRAELAGLLSLLGSLSLHARAGERKRVNGEAAPRTRQLARRLQLPAWLQQTLLGLDLPVPDDAKDRLTLVTQAALGLALAARLPLGHLRVGHPLADALRRLGNPELAEDLAQQLWSQAPASPASLAPEAVPLLWRSLRLAPPVKPPADAGIITQLESELEAVRAQLVERWEDEQGRLSGLKLESMAEFAAGAAHEINTPLAIISGQAQHLLKTEESLERAQSLERIMTQAHRIHHLLRDLLIFARPPALRTKKLSLARLVNKVVESLADQAAQRQVRMELDLSSKSALLGDESLLEGAVTALLRNAIEAATVGGWVRVSIKAAKANRIDLVIEDDGAGLSAVQQKHLFDPFFSGRGAGRGVGMGLPKAWRIAKLHGGALTGPIASQQPTRFVLELPLATAKPKHSRRHGVAHARAKT